MARGLAAAIGLCLSFSISGVAQAESPIITRMATAEVQQQNATAAANAAKDPVTGNIALESEPMQCAIACQLTIDKRINLCLGRAPEAALRDAGISKPRNCVRESAQKYDACLLSCGLQRRLPIAKGAPAPQPPKRLDPSGLGTGGAQ